METDQRAEIEFLMSRLSAALGYDNDAALPPILLAGYGAGGSALAYLAGENSFLTQYNNVLGVVAIESHLWSAYLPEVGNVNVRLPRGIISRQWALIVGGVKSLLPKKVTRTGPLPAARLPVLYLVSGRALDTSKGPKSYEAVFACVHRTEDADSYSSPVVLAAIEGAGPLDYQDFPFTHPIYSFLLPGLKGAEKSEYPIGDTASIIGNFASLLLERAKPAEEYSAEVDFEETAKPNIYIPPRYGTSGKLYTESKNFPGFGL